MARNDRRSRALLRGLRRQARRGNLTAREQRDLLDQEELFRQARRENAPLTTAAVLAGAGLLGTPGGRAALGEFTGMDPQSRLKRQMERDEAEHTRGMRKDALDDLREMSRLQDELDRYQVAQERLKEIEEGDKQETPTEIVNKAETIEAKAVPMEYVAGVEEDPVVAESGDRELDEIIMLPEVEISEPLEAFTLPDGTFVPAGTQKEQDDYIRRLGGADMVPEGSNLEGLVEIESDMQPRSGEELLGIQMDNPMPIDGPTRQPVGPLAEPGQDIFMPEDVNDLAGLVERMDASGNIRKIGYPRVSQEFGGIVDPAKRADRVHGRAQDTLMDLVEAEQAGKEKLADRLLSRYMRQWQKYDDLQSRVPFEGGLDYYPTPTPGPLGPLQPKEPYSNPEFDRQMEEYNKKMEEYENRKVKPSGSSMQFGGQTPKMQDFMQKIARKYGIK